MKSEFLPYGRQCIEDDDLAAVLRVLQSDWLTTGPETEFFEKNVSQMSGAMQAVSCSSGTAGLHLASMALGLGPSDKVVIPAITFLATANAVRYTNAEVIFADVNPDTGLTESEHIAEALTHIEEGIAAAVFPVHLNGQCCDMASIQKLADINGMKIVEDASHAIGARYFSRDGDEIKVGACANSNMTVFSLHPVKTVTMGEGGVVTTNSQDLADRLRRLRNHGMVHEAKEYLSPDQAFNSKHLPNPWYYELHNLGFNYRASDLHCALGSSQLSKLERFIERRAKLVAQYDTLLSPFSEIIRPVKRVPGIPAWHLYVVLIDFETIEMERSELMKALRQHGIGSQVHYLPLYRQPYYEKLYGKQSLPGAEQYYSRCLSLPLYPAMNISDVDRVVSALNEIIRFDGHFS